MNGATTTQSAGLQPAQVGKRRVAWQVGRHGEVAGGMTQVVNAYMAWSFDLVQVRVLMTRDGSSGLRGLVVFLKALRQFFTIKGTRDNLFVVHLSQGGSFVREGLLLLLARARGFGTVAHIHGSSFVAFSQRFPWLVRTVLGAAGKVIVLSDKTQACLQQLIDPSRVELVPNAVAEGVGRDKERLVVFGGGVSHRKGVDVLVQAWQRVGVDSGWRLAVAGPVIDAQVVPDALADADFLGAVNHAELMALLERSAVAVLPSRDEAMPMFILEAMGRSNCVVSTRVGGIPAVLDNGCGVLVDAGDVDQLAQALGRVLKDDAFREQTASTGRKAFDVAYSARAIYPRVERLWLSVLPGAAHTN